MRSSEIHSSDNTSFPLTDDLSINSYALWFVANVFNDKLKWELPSSLLMVCFLKSCRLHRQLQPSRLKYA